MVGMPPPYPGYPVPPRSSSRTGLFIAIVAVVTIVAVVGLAVGLLVVAKGALKPTVASGAVKASTEVSLNRGKVVFTDDFKDPASGWTTDTLPSGTTFTYTASGYVVVAKGTLNHFATSPYEVPVEQVAISVAATQSSDAPTGAGYGVSCWRGTDAAELRYVFGITTGGDWEIDRYDGGITTKPIVMRAGSSSATVGSTPLVVQGICARLADLHTIRLILFAGTQKIADISDTANNLPDTGWLPDLMVTSETIRPSTVTATRFEVRDLAG
jgi:hypothetical protein